MSIQLLGGLIVAGIILLILLLVVGQSLVGLVVIGERQVGIVVKKFARRALAPGSLIALNGEAGYQADTLAPGWHFGYWPWQFTVIKAPVVTIPQGEIGLVVAAAGE